MANWKRIGNKVERKFRTKLEKRGYRVTKSSASLGMYDLIAWKVERRGDGVSIGKLKFIQCKRTRIKAKERRAIAEDPLPDVLIVTKEIRMWVGRKKMIMGKVKLETKRVNP